MIYNEILNSKNGELDSVLEHLKVEYNKIRTGRANPAILDSVKVDYYGVPTELKQVANITVPEARQILIQPWEKNMLENIEQAILKSDLGLTPANDGSVLRISLPAMTEENRKELVKVLNQKTEEARIKLRSIREAIWKEITTKEKEENISEDEKYKAKEELQKIIDGYNTKIEELRKKKEEEIMTV